MTSDTALYYNSQNASILKNALGLDDPDGSGFLTLQEASLPGNELIQENFSVLASQYTEAYPLTAAALTQDPLLIRLMSLKVEEEKWGVSTNYPEMNQDIPLELPGTRLFDSIDVAVTDFERNLPRDLLDQLKSGIFLDPILQLFAQFYRDYASNPELTQFSMTRVEWDQKVEEHNQVSIQKISAEETWNTLLAIWGAQIDPGFGISMTMEDPPFLKLDMAPAQIAITSEGFQKYLENPEAFHNRHRNETPTPIPNSLEPTTALSSRVTLTFPKLSLSVGLGVSLEFEEGATATSTLDIYEGEISWDVTRPLVSLQGIAISFPLGILDPMPILGITVLQNKIVGVGHRSNGHYFFVDLTSQIRSALCHLDPPTQCSVNPQKLVEVLFDEQGCVRENASAHDLIRAIQFVLKNPSALSGSFPGSDLVKKIPLDQLKEEVVVKDFSTTFGPKDFGSINDVTIDISQAQLTSSGKFPSGITVEAEVPFLLNGQMTMDEGAIPLSLGGQAKVYFDTSNGQGWVTLTKLDLPLSFPGKEKLDDYVGEIRVPFSLPDWKPTTDFSSYSRMLETALYSLSVDITKNGDHLTDFRYDGETDPLALIDGSAATLLGNLVGSFGSDDEVTFGGNLLGVKEGDFIGAGFAGNLSGHSGLGALVGNDVEFGASRDEFGSYHLVPRGNFTGQTTKGNFSGPVDDGEIVVTPNNDNTYTVEIRHLGIDLSKAEITGTPMSGTADLNGLWIVPADSLADLFKPERWIGKGNLSFDVWNPIVSGDVAGTRAGVEVLEVTDISFSDPLALLGHITGDLRGFGWADGLDNSIMNANFHADINGSILPRNIIFHLAPEKIDMTPIVETEPVKPGESITAEAESTVEHFKDDELPKAERKVVSVIPEGERIKDPKTPKEKVQYFLQQIIDALPSVRGLESRHLDIQIAPKIKYGSDGFGTLPLLGDKPDGLQMKVQEGTELDPMQSGILAENGTLKKFKLVLNHPITIAGIFKVYGVSMTTDRCPLTGRVRHNLVVRLCGKHGDFFSVNLLPLLELVGKQFNACKFYPEFRKKYGVDLPLYGIPANLTHLGEFLYELFKLYGDTLDTFARSEKNAPDLIDIQNVAMQMQIHLQPGLALDVGALHAETDERARGTFEGDFVWKPDDNKSLDVYLAGSEEQSVAGINVSASGDKAFSGLIDSMGGIHYHTDGEKDQTAYEVEVRRAHVDHLNLKYTKTGETEPTVHLVAEQTDTEHSYIDLSALRVGRVREDNGNFHYEFSAGIDKAYSPKGHFDFKSDERHASLDFSTGQINDVTVDLTGKSFPASQADNQIFNGFEKVFVDGNIEQAQNPYVTPNHSWLSLDLGQARHLAADRLSIQNGHFHVETDGNDLPIQLSGVLDLLARLPDDPAFKGLESIGVVGPAQIYLNGADAGISYKPMEGSLVSSLVATVTGDFKKKLEGIFGEVAGEAHSLVVPLQDLELRQIPLDGKTPHGDKNEKTALRRVTIGSGVRADGSGEGSTSFMGDLGERKIELPNGSFLTLDSKRPLSAWVATPGDYTTLNVGDSDDHPVWLAIALWRPDSNSKSGFTPVTQDSGTISMKQGVLTLAGFNGTFGLREFFYFTNLSGWARLDQLKKDLKDQLKEYSILVP